MRMVLGFVAVLLYGLPLCASSVYVTDCSIGPVGGPYVTQDTGGYCSIVYNPPLSNQDYEISGTATDERINPYYDQLEAGSYKYLEGQPPSPLAYSVVTSAYETLETAGPVRPGIISFSISNGDNSGGSSQAGISDGTHTYGEGSCSSCGFSEASEPFELGTVFSVLAAATDTGLIWPPTPEAGAAVTFSLFEANGITPVAIIDAPAGTPGIPLNFNAPEPGTLGISLLSMLVGVSYWSHRKRSR